MSAVRLACVCLLVAAAGCARAKPTLPTGAGTPFPGYEAVYGEAVERCRGARTVLAELALSGRAGGTRLRGRINAGLAAPGSVRLEAVALGRPIFILVARNDDATLLLTREDRVVRNAPPAAIIEALAGVALTPDELRAVVAGCGLGAGTPSDGRMFSNDWAAVDVGGVATYLRRVQGRWHVAGAVRDPLTILYDGFSSGLASTVHVRTGSVADITLRVSQLEINTRIDDAAFEVNVPADAVPLSLEELRKAGPLGERDK